mmetsp:Transcript_77176/g.200816  ORF Transcript_77176/g.200816 Transcript_77176/m.200816 type:complete len:523 (-) Transcript_77176:552-2120(-)
MQRAVDGLLCGVVPSSFGENVLIVCLEEVAPPSGFESNWANLAAGVVLEEQPWLKEASLAQVSVMVIVASVPDETHKKLILDLGNFLRGHPLTAPPVILVPVRKPEDPQNAQGVQQYLKPLLMSSSIDDVIFGMPSGFALALAVQAKLSNLNVQISTLQDRLHERSVKLEQRDTINNAIDFAQWQYLRTRLFHAIPPVRNDLEDAHQQSVAGFQIGPRISHGVFGAVHMAAREVEDQPGQVQCYSMFIMDKKQSKFNVYDLKTINRFLRVLGELDNFRHPNLSHLVATPHSPERLCVVTEMCGRQTLFARLKLRDRPASKAVACPLPTASMQSLIEQVCSAVCHLHAVASICHRDIKPENFTIEQRPDDSVNVKLGGFELAMVQSGALKCKSSCGTIPFAAPETLLASRNGYDGMAADMWSLGVLFVEVSCGLRRVEESILELSGLETTNRSAKDCLLRPSGKTAKKMIAAFMQEGFVEGLFEHAVPEARSLEPWLLPMISNLVQVRAASRPTAASLQDFLL